MYDRLPLLGLGALHKIPSVQFSNSTKHSWSSQSSTHPFNCPSLASFCIIPRDSRAIMASLSEHRDKSSPSDTASAAPGGPKKHSKQVSWYIPGQPQIPEGTKVLLEKWSGISPENGGIEKHVESVVRNRRQPMYLIFQLLRSAILKEICFPNC